MQHNTKELLMLLCKLLGELQSPLLKKCLVPAAKTIGADFFEIAAPEIGEVVGGRKNTQYIGKKQFENNWDVKKRKPNVKQKKTRSISRKGKSKTTRSRKDVFEKINMRINRTSHFRYGALTHFSVEIYNKVLVLETFMSSHTQEEFPSASLDESSFEFELETDRNLYFGMTATHLS